jgi:regulator of sigma E protease
MMTVIAFLVTIGVLVTIHEYGHFQVARWCNVKVLRFSVGFGQPLWRKTFGADQTEFVLAAIPLGGFVKMLDENELKAAREAGETDQANYSEADLARAFNRQVVWKRMLIVLAGPVANLLLAILLFWLLMMHGVTGVKPIVGELKPDGLAAKSGLVSGELIQKVNGKLVDTWQEAQWILLEKSLSKQAVEIETVRNNQELHVHTINFEQVETNTDIDLLEKLGMALIKPAIQPVVDEVLPGSAAEQAGFQSNDLILSINGVAVTDWAKVSSVTQASAGQLLQFKVRRNSSTLLIKATPRIAEVNNQRVGQLGFSVKLDQATLDQFLVNKAYPPLQALSLAAHKTYDTAIFSLKMLGKMLTGQVSWKGISGPVTIADYAGKSAQVGWVSFLGFLALVSISIGVLNLLPIPVLDGGHLMYYIAEILKGSPVNEQTMIVGQKIGFGILGLLMTIAIFNDVNRLFTG